MDAISHLQQTIDNEESTYNFVLEKLSHGELPTTYEWAGALGYVERYANIWYTDTVHDTYFSNEFTDIISGITRQPSQFRLAFTRERIISRKPLTIIKWELQHNQVRVNIYQNGYRTKLTWGPTITSFSHSYIGTDTTGRSNSETGIQEH